MNNINVSFIERLYIENRGYINSLDENGLKSLINTFLYRTILDNAFSSYIETKTINPSTISSIVGSEKTKEIIDIYLKQNNYLIIDDVNKSLILKK